MSDINQGPPEGASELEKSLWRRLEQLKSLPESATVEEKMDTFIQWLQDVRRAADDSGEKSISEGLDTVMPRIREFRELLTPEGAKRWAVERLKGYITTSPIKAEHVELAKAAISAASEEMQRQWLHLGRFGLSDDAVGVVIRGHIVVDNVLKSAIQAYLPKRPPLRKVSRFFVPKVLLGYELGILDSNECAILTAFNEMRVLVAHYIGGVRSESAEPEFGAADEERLWNIFTANEAMRGPWPEYDATKFPQYLRYIVLHLYLHLQRKAEALEKKRLPESAVSGSFTDDERNGQALLTLLVARFVNEIGPFRAGEKGSGG